MKDYEFLFKPIFFIFKLVFSCWLVFKIEYLSPSDFGKYESLFKQKQKLSSRAYEQARLSSPELRHIFLSKLCYDYKTGLIDSTILDQQLKRLLNSNKKIAAK